jgi:hypothetical protein
MMPSIWRNWDFEIAEPFLFPHLAIKKNPVWTRTKEFCEKMQQSCQIRRNCFYYITVFRNRFQHRVKMQLDPLSVMANVASLQNWEKTLVPANWQNASYGLLNHFSLCDSANENCMKKTQNMPFWLSKMLWPRIVDSLWRLVKGTAKPNTYCWLAR